jgi:hypothetical protein
MTRNWRQADWPNFMWDRLQISISGERFLLCAGVAITKLLDRPRGQLNERQEKGLLRMFREGREGFKAASARQLQHNYRCLARYYDP